MKQNQNNRELLPDEMRILRVLDRFGYILSSGFYTEESLRSVVRIVCEQMDADSAIVHQYDQSRGEFFSQVGEGPRIQYSPPSNETSVSIIHAGQIIFADDARSNPTIGEAAFIQQQGIKSCIAAPLRLGDEYVGVLYVNYLTPRNLKEKELLFTVIANQVAIAVNLGRLHTTHHQLKMQLDEAYQKRIKAELDATTAKMAQLMAHHIKNYLGSARLQLDNVTQRAALSREQREELERVDANMKRCIGIAPNLFKPYRPAPVVEASPSLLIKNALDLLGEPSDITITVSVPNALPKIKIEANNAVDFFHELLTNAARVVRERLQEGQIEEGHIEILGRLDDEGRVELLFTNNGLPLAKDRWERIFEQFSGFSREERSRESLGLGLWGARTFFRRQSGDIFVLESNEAHTTFVVKLPIATTAST